MIHEIIDTAVHGIKPTIKFFKNKHPDETVVFAFPTKFSEFRSSSNIGFVRQGVLILSENSLFFKTVSISINSVLFVLATLSFVAIFIKSLSLISLLVLAIIISTTTQWFPLERYTVLSEIKEANLELISRPGIFLSSENTFYMLAIIVEDKKMFFKLTKNLPDEIQLKFSKLLRLTPK